MVACGVEVAVASDDAALLDSLLLQLSPPFSPGPELAPSARQQLELRRADGGIVLRRDRRTVARCDRQDHLLGALERELERLVSRESAELLFVHAGVVAWNDGALVLPGRSGSGKSTLVAALVRAGATYYSDEFAVLDDDARVHPYPRPLALRTPGGVERMRVELLGGTIGERPLPVRLVVLARHRHGAPFRPERLPPGRAVLGLLRHTVTARKRPERALEILSRLCGQALGWAGDRGEADDVAPLLLERLRALGADQPPGASSIMLE